MLWNADELKGFRLHATDGDLGHVHDVLFADDTWQMRYLVVDTGWIFGRRVLIGPQVVGEPDAGQRTIAVNLTRDQIKHSPSIDTDRPVSRQQEDALYSYYGWAPYWTAGGAAGMPGGAATMGLGAAGIAGGTTDFTGPPPTSSDRIATERDSGGPAAEAMGQPQGDPHLRSAREVSGYTVRAGREDVAKVSGLLLDTDGWKVRWIIADTGSFLTSHPVLLSPEWVRDVDWPDARLNVTVSADKITGAPTYDPTRTLSREQEQKIYDWHGVRPYW